MKKIITIIAISTTISCGVEKTCNIEGTHFHNGELYWKANNGSLHTGQVSDYYAELEEYYEPDCENCDEID